MRKNNKKQIVFNKIAKNLNFYDKIIMKVFKRYTFKIYKLGLNDAFNWENQKIRKAETRLKHIRNYIIKTHN